MAKINFCPRCGNKLHEQDKFCSACGWRKEDASKINNEEQDSLQEQDLKSYEESSDKNQKPVERGTFSISKISIILSIVAVIVLVGGIFFIKHSTFDENNRRTPSNNYVSKNEKNQKSKIKNKESIKKNSKDDKKSVVQETNKNTNKSEANVKPKPKNVNVKINQVDNTSFPVLKLYASIMDHKDESIDNVPFNYFTIKEKLNNANSFIDQNIEKVEQLNQDEALSVSLVMDTSGSMHKNSKLYDAKYAAKSFIDIVQEFDELQILEFNDYVRMKSDFTSDKNMLKESISQLYASGQTALYDAIYNGLVQTSAKQGAKCVIVFTDGISNKDTRSKEDVIDLSRKTGIPIYTIGIGNNVEQFELQDIAESTGGYFVHTPSASELEMIYKNIFRLQKEQYVITYRTNNTVQDTNWREIQLGISGDTYIGAANKEYMPQVIKPSLKKINVMRINDIINNNTDNGNYSVIIKDLSNGEEYRAGLYEQKMPASALMNVQITLAVADLIKEGKLTLDTKIPFYYTVGGRGKFTKNNNGEMHSIDELLKVMMNYSDNNCTNSFITYIGMDKINRITAKYGFTESEIQRMIAVYEDNKENWTTCEELSDMLKILYSDSLPIGSSYMNQNFKILDNTNRNGILKYLPNNVFVLHHNGITPTIYNEIAFIGHGSTKYIITVLSCDGKQQELAETTALISKYVYDEMIK